VKYSGIEGFKQGSAEYFAGTKNSFAVGGHIGIRSRVPYGKKIMPTTCHMGDMKEEDIKGLAVKSIWENAPYSSSRKIINISAGGVAVETTKMLRINKEYNLKINYKGSLLRLGGFVIWAMRIRDEKKESGDIVPVYKAGMTFLEPVQ
jgi:hypothetical protein